MEREGKASIQSVERSFRLLEVLAAGAASVTGLARQLGLAKSTVHRLLQNLVELGYVRQSAGDGSYHLSMRMFEVGSEALGRMDVLAAARPRLEALAARVGETVHLVVRDAAEAVYVYKAEAGDLRMSSRLGLRVPMYCTGVGKAMLATLPYAEVERLWQRSELRVRTPRTIRSFEELAAQLAQVRRQGWALDDEENELGIRCVAVALPGAMGTAEAAFSVSGLAAHLDEERQAELARECLAVRADILVDLGLRP